MPYPEPNSTDSAETAARYAEVAVPVPLRQTFTYRVPAAMQNAISIGARVGVSFARRRVTGYVVALHAVLDPELGLEEKSILNISELIDEQPLITSEILQLTQWAADYYAAGWGEMLKSSLPAGINAAIEKVISLTAAGRAESSGISAAKTIRHNVLLALAETGEQTFKELAVRFGEGALQRALTRLTQEGHVITSHRTVETQVKPVKRKIVSLNPVKEDSGGATTPQHQHILETLREHGGDMLFTELLSAASVNSSPIMTLERRGFVTISVREVLRDPFRFSKLPAAVDFALTEGQAAVLTSLEDALKAAKYGAFLLHGVTGSGKTEVYIRAMRQALELERGALMLVPEIALTPVFSTRLRSVFGDEVAILHSNLSAGERYDEWRRIRRGDARIVIGTRSAVFAPIHRIGLVIVDEEHDASYRQSEAPFYSARDLAVMRAHFAGAVAILGSATPALESFHNAQTGKYKYLRLDSRVGQRPLPDVELIDMRGAVKRDGKTPLLSDELAAAIEETHERGEQSIILLNRRGFSQFVICRSCGESIRCQNCDITLTHHKRDGQLVCHYCNFRLRVPTQCPQCESKFIYFMGDGTERVEDELTARFPAMRIERVDRDSTSRKRELENVLDRFAAGETDMLVGTQMLAKGHDFHNVTLVGVISADAGLAIPDFRSAERTFQLLTQVAGRAGRGDLPGRVLIQTYFPEHYALRHARQQDYDGFFSEEIEFRRKLLYPPFAVLACLTIKHQNYEYAAMNAQTLKESLVRQNKENQCRILGVAPAPLARLRNEFRLHIFVKAASRRRLRQTIELAMHDAGLRGCDLKIISVEIDPLNLL